MRGLASCKGKSVRVENRWSQVISAMSLRMFQLYVMFDDATYVDTETVTDDEAQMFLDFLLYSEGVFE